jgi:uncharacterized damage-inducible protein DinB
MNDQMTRSKFLSTLKSDRETWESLLAQFDQDQMTQPFTSENWALKDIIAHVTWYERQMVGVLQARTLVGSDLWDLPHNERNKTIFEENKHRPLNEVKREAQEVYKQLFEVLGTLSDEELVNSRKFSDMPEDWVPWKVIADNSFNHYHQHMPEVQAWLET